VAYEIPTVGAFKAQFPEYAGLTDAVVNAAISEAARRVDDSWTSGDFPLAIVYLAAHFLASYADAVGGGAIQSESFGPISVSYANTSSTDGLAGTSYGLRYLDLLKLNQTGPLVV
jgi:hypothetical protein